MPTEAAGAGPDVPPPRPCSRERMLAIMALFPLAFIVAAFMLDAPATLFDGLLAILRSRDTLTTDYMGLGGIGAALLNAGLLALLAIAIYWRSGAVIGGAAVACLWLVLGFGLFGKNLLNVWGIVLGVALYARYQGEPFAKHINTAFFGAALAPIFSEILFSSVLPLSTSLPLALATTLALGFVLPPAAAHLFRAHEGHSLYNMGFVAGLLGTLTVAIYKSYGFVPEPVFIWTRGHDGLLGTLLVAGIATAAAAHRPAAGRLAGGHGDAGRCPPARVRQRRLRRTGGPPGGAGPLLARRVQAARRGA